MTLRRPRLSTLLPTALALSLAAAWASREVAFARERAKQVASQTINLDAVKMAPYDYERKRIGQIGLYVDGDTPASAKFVTGRFVIDAGQGKSPHPPHTHAEEEVMIVEKGQAEIFCDGKTTKVGPGSVMYTTPNAPHGIVNTGDEPVVFYFVKWAARSSQ